MNVETLIYAYLAVCFSMIAFNCVCIFIFRQSAENVGRQSAEFERHVKVQLERIQNGQAPDEKHQKYLRRKLRRTGNLTALDETMTRLFATEPEVVRGYLSAIYPVFIFLAEKYSRKDEIRAAYFLYIIKRFGILKGKTGGQLHKTLFGFLHSDSLYCRENALQAVYSTEDCACAVKALKIIDTGGHFHHSKLLADGLLEFPGDHKALARELWKEFDSFSVRMRVTILNYLRFRSGDWCGEILALLLDTHQDDELRFSCIRYFGKYRHAPAAPVLLDFAAHPEKRRWEYAAIACSALSNYQSEEAVSVLKDNLYSYNWYIRFNASQTLEHYGLSYADFTEILGGNDRYAREILQYRMDQRNARKKEAVPK